MATSEELQALRSFLDEQVVNAEAEVALELIQQITEHNARGLLDGCKWYVTSITEPPDPRLPSNSLKTKFRLPL
jgi:hypothetical protein